MKAWITAVAAVALCVGLGACSPKAQQVVQRRAAFDLSCPAAQLQVQPLEEIPWRLRQPTSDWGVVGCGQRAVYHAFCARARAQRRCTVTQTESTAQPGNAVASAEDEP